MQEVTHFAIDDSQFEEGFIPLEHQFTEDYVHTERFPITYDELKNSYKVMNYISFDGLGIDLLDNNKEFYDNGEYIAYLSSYDSGSIYGPVLYDEVNGQYLYGYSNDSAPIIYNIDNNNYPTGITIRFYGYCCNNISVRYYSSYSDYSLIHSETHIVHSSEKFIEFNSYIKENHIVKRIEIEFVSTPLPNQTIKIEGIMEGKINNISKIRSSELLEEINILSDDLPINSFNFEAALNDSIQEEDPINIYSNGKYYGTFFVDETERVSQNIYNIKCSNSIGLLEKTKFRDWKFSTFDIRTELNFFLGKMAEETSVKASKPSEYTNYYIYGHIPIESYRKALCEYAYACGFMVDSSYK